MELNDIIKDDNDRLFIVDNECFIIFTGDTIEDDKPFIRIGTWADLPVQCIPLIENIIIPDEIIGNPVNEQFNIDSKNSSQTKFIGTKSIVKSYVDFQALFNLDLSDAEIIDVEKDLPSLSQEKIIFNNEQIIGVFYHGGNFKIVFSGNTIFDLNEIENQSFTDIKIHELLSSKNYGTNRYSGSGIIMVDNSTFFYKNGYFSLYQFPKEYYHTFSEMRIDPVQVREILLPNPNIQSLIRFLKWKNNKKSRVKLFTEDNEWITKTQKLFKGLDIVKNDFNEMNLGTGDGLSIENYSSTQNVKLTYINVKPSYKDIQIAFMKEYNGIYKILEEQLDGIFVPYTIYEQAVMFFKSAKSPVVIISDDNKNLSKLDRTDKIVMEPGVKYEFLRYLELDNLLKDAISRLDNREILSEITGEEERDIKVLLMEDVENSEELPLTKTIDICNIAAILRIYLESTTDRKYAQKIRDAFQEIKALERRNTILKNHKSKIKISLCFFNNSIYEFIELNIRDSIDEISNPIKIYDEPLAMLRLSKEYEKNELHERILHDRKRLLDLLSLYNTFQKKKKKDIRSLNSDLSDRKMQTSIDDIEIDDSLIKKDIFRRRIKKFAMISLIPILLLLLSYGSYRGYLYYQDYSARADFIKEQEKLQEEAKKKAEKAKQQTLKKKNERKELINKYNIHVSDRDIYNYANKVALKNGYREITFRALKKRNPNWIFPGNIFRMLDGERIVVRYGDTLWGYSEKKLMYRNVEFYKLIEEIKEVKKTGRDFSGYIKKAKGFAFNIKHFDMLKKMASK